MSAENVKLVRDMYDAFAKGNVPGVLGSLDPHVQWYEAENFIYADQNPYVGPQAVLEGVFMRIVTDFDNFAVTPHEILDAGDKVVALGTYSGTNKKTGKAVRAQMAHVWSIENGKAVKFQQYTDTKQFADAVSA